MFEQSETITHESLPSSNEWKETLPSLEETHILLAVLVEAITRGVTTMVEYTSKRVSGTLERT